MRRIRSRDTGPEWIVRRLVHGLGYRYRLHRKDLPGKPDLVFPSRQKVIFIHGCFWHSHGCSLSHTPKSNLGYWLPKLERNRRRDEAVREALKAEGWDTLVIWECQTADPEQVAASIRQFLG